ncbi:MAG TPA: tetratricopeptide repeat protein [Bryobacteraceae bacterium]|nr:tetratricopeptide repeat protein [Bryobacteraceae bacterium]
MNRFFVGGILAIAGIATLAAQQPAPKPEPAGQAPAAKQPQPKSKGEVEAIQAMFQAPNADARIKAADDLITKYADTDFKDLALFFAAASYEQKGDSDKAIVYAERAVDANPNHYQSLLLLARLIAQRTREHDLDREEKLGRVEGYVKSAEKALATAQKPNPQLSDEQWTGAKKDMLAQGHEALGMAAMARKKFDVAATEFKTAVEGSTQPDPATMVRLGSAYNQGGKYDDAIAVLDKVLAMPDAHPAVKQFAQAEKVRATQMKTGGAKPAAAPGTSVTPGTVEIKKP